MIDALLTRKHLQKIIDNNTTNVPLQVITLFEINN